MAVAFLRSFTLDQAVSVPPERLIAFGRLVLAAFACAATFADPTPQYLTAQLAVMGTYALFAVVCVLFVMLRPITVQEQVFAHAADMLCVSILMYLTEGAASPFFAFFTFILLAGTLRWNWQGAFVTALLLTATFVLLVLSLGAHSLLSGVGELSRAIIRSGYILVAGVMLSYVGAFQERSRKRLEKLAAWPGPDLDGQAKVPIRSALEHAARIMQAPRVLIIWEQPNEPFRHVALWSASGLQYSRERLDRFGALVTPAWVAASFSVRGRTVKLVQGDQYLRLTTARAIDPDLQQTFSITSALTAPFDLPGCRGRIFLLDQSGSTHEDVVMADLVAMRLGVDVEHHLLRQELELAAALSERSRLANDLHDGILQGLAAANIQLTLASGDGSEDLARQLAQTRSLLSAEQRRVRSFVEDSRSQLRQTSGVSVPLRDELSKRLRDLSTQWGCQVDLTIDPPNLHTSPENAHHVRHLLAEAVSNAVRHGKASAIKIEIMNLDDCLRLHVRDNGTGFPGLIGTFSDEELAHQNIRPDSLLQRAKALGGRLTLQTSASGSDIQVEFPHDQQ